MGLRITTLHASSGVAANVGCHRLHLRSHDLGIPISTTHAAGSSVMGAGVASGRGINLKVVGEMLLAWVVTIPVTSVIAFLVFKLTQLPTPAAWVSVIALLFVLGGAIAYAMTHAVSAADVAQEIPDEEDLASTFPPSRTSRDTVPPPEPRLLILSAGADPPGVPAPSSRRGQARPSHPMRAQGTRTVSASGGAAR